MKPTWWLGTGIFWGLISRKLKLWEIRTISLKDYCHIDDIPQTSYFIKLFVRKVNFFIIYTAEFLCLLVQIIIFSKIINIIKFEQAGIKIYLLK